MKYSNRSKLHLFTFKLKYFLKIKTKYSLIDFVVIFQIQSSEFIKSLNF